MAALRATSFFAGNYSGAGPVTLYTVPAGYRIILRSINVYNYANTSSPATIAVPGVVTLLSLNLQPVGVAGAQFNLQPWMVLGPGTVIAGYSVAGKTIGCLLSGSLLFI